MFKHPIRLVTFDALYTLIVPRLPIHVQYSQAFEPFLGVLDPASIRQSFRVGMAERSLIDPKPKLRFSIAFKSIEAEKAVYAGGSQAWWSEVIRRTALGAGANEMALNASISEIVPRLLHRFSSKEGYRAFEDAIPTILSLQRDMDIKTAVVSNADARIRSAILDLDFPASLGPIVLSEEFGAEKPSPSIFHEVISAVNLKSGTTPILPEECLHVGDEFYSDYEGARAAGMNALHLQRAGEDGEQAHQDEQKLPPGVDVVKDLQAVTRWIKARNDSEAL
ncbi:hypothetical protein DXG03_003133 [Asterophora parasitica]|uniref:Haloacid dehalogenase-like hydrolase domain-containing protein 3 n=1 Tax=Asterophora parasitica TaxID=117018 RepID=A0A9P7GK85_9AGAR|nr:hypothetical protein DXG03_003133 [Asterophora parasitica]